MKPLLLQKKRRAIEDPSPPDVSAAEEKKKRRSTRNTSKTRTRHEKEKPTDTRKRRGHSKNDVKEEVTRSRKKTKKRAVVEFSIEGLPHHFWEQVLTKLTIHEQDSFAATSKHAHHLVAQFWARVQHLVISPETMEQVFGPPHRKGSYKNLYSFAAQLTFLLRRMDGARLASLVFKDINSFHWALFEQCAENANHDKKRKRSKDEFLRKLLSPVRHLVFANCVVDIRDLASIQKYTTTQLESIVITESLFALDDQSRTLMTDLNLEHSKNALIGVMHEKDINNQERVLKSALISTIIPSIKKIYYLQRS